MTLVIFEVMGGFEAQIEKEGGVHVGEVDIPVTFRGENIGDADAKAKSYIDINFSEVVWGEDLPA